MSDDSKKVKVNVDSHTAFMLGAALGKERVGDIAKAWVENNPIPAAKAWAERNPEEAKFAWAEGGDTLHKKVGAWVESHPDQVAFAWAQENISKVHKATDLNAEDPHAEAWYETNAEKTDFAWYEINK